uniref:Uncharacterized protein MANES_13G021000 n=1 Tax=Rhizophora mucronata TaxID=61149 RepID=A0A2P2LX41_RHIMU
MCACFWRFLECLRARFLCKLYCLLCIIIRIIIIIGYTFLRSVATLELAISEAAFLIFLLCVLYQGLLIFGYCLCPIYVKPRFYKC